MYLIKHHVKETYGGGGERRHGSTHYPRHEMEVTDQIHNSPTSPSDE